MALAVGLLTLAGARRAGAQAAPALLPPPPAQGEEHLTLDAIERRLEQVKASKTLDEAAKAELKKTYEQARERLQAALDAAGRAATFDKRIADAPVATKQARAELALRPTQPELEVPPDATLAQLQEKLTQKQAALAEARKMLEGLETELKRRPARRAELPAAITALKEKKAQIKTDLAAAPPPDLSPEALRAQRTLLEARLAAVNQEIQAAEKEPRAYDATSELLTLKRDLAAAEIQRREREIEQLQQLVETRGRMEKERQARAAQREAAEAARKHPALAPLAKRNVALAESRRELDASIQAASERLAEEQNQLDELNKRFERAKAKLKAVGLTNAVGELLRKERAQLPQFQPYENLAGELRETNLELLRLQDQRADLASLEDEVRQTLASLGPVPGADRAELEAATRDILQTRRDYLDKLIDDYETYSETLGRLSDVEVQLSNEIDQFAHFIDERILWIRSSPPFGWSDLREIPQSLAWLAGSENWTRAGKAVWADLRGRWIEVAWIGLLALVLLYYQPRLRGKLRAIGEKVQRTSVAPIGRTLEAAGVTVSISLLWPGLLALIGWRLRLIRADGATEFAHAVGSGLLSAGLVYFPLELLRQSCRALGLAEAHFQWPAHALGPVRRALRPLMLVLVPMAFIVSASDLHGGRARDDALGRLAFIVSMLAISLFAHRMLRRRSVVIKTLLARDPQSWLARLRPMWHLLLAGLPLLLAGIAAVGYYYTAMQLAWRLNLTVYYALAVFFLNGAVLRWVVVARIKLARLQALERRAEQQSEGKESGTAAGEIAGAQIETPEPDSHALSIQTRKFVRSLLALVSVVVIWLIWVGVLPALGALDRVELWPVTVSTTEQVAAAGEAAGATPAITQVVTRLEWVTLADLCLAVIFLVVTVVATRNVPGMLEMTVLQRLPFDAGGRYAITTISRYVIAVVGIIVVSTTLGIRWSSVQWLVAAVTVGLGFGLQEIFANFVSGLILLFERPIRVGDIVTVDTVSGVVSKIQMRATTITNWDRQEYVVPNKEFITGRLLNWTLSNQINRIVIPVGVAYGSDTQLAHQLLTKIVEEHPLIMKDPAPMVTLEGFGESTLNFFVRCYLPNMDNRGTTIHELYMTIDQEFRAANIEMAFPQRDIHIRSVEGVFPLARARGASPNGSAGGDSPRPKIG